VPTPKTGNKGLVFSGRIVPRAIKYLKRPTLDSDGNEPAASTMLMFDSDMTWGVMYRYAEYCVTAPLLFISVVCLLVVDAPAWYQVYYSL
jgi:hypothetical protein